MLPTVHILILAAGTSSRMRGPDKLMQKVGDLPLLRHVAGVALATGAPVYVTLPTEAAERRGVLVGLPLNLIEVPDTAQGMSRSLRRGVETLTTLCPGPLEGLMILPADMPGFTATALSDMIRLFQMEPDCIFCGATETGQSGHPVIFPRELWPKLAAVDGDKGGQSVLRTEQFRVRIIPLPGFMATLDLDTPEDWAAFRDGPAHLH